jgi:hypothetical protein
MSVPGGDSPSSGAEVRATVEDYRLATGWDVRFVDRPGDPAAALGELRDAGLDVESEEAVALAARNRELVDWLASDAQALRSFAADPRAAVAARDAGRDPPVPGRASEGTFQATPASRKMALAQIRGEVAAWALSSSENLRVLLVSAPSATIHPRSERSPGPCGARRGPRVDGRLGARTPAVDDVTRHQRRVRQGRRARPDPADGDRP